MERGFLKQLTKDDYIESLYRVTHYIEQHYSEELTLESLAKVAGFSKYHFHRIFKTIVGESLGSHIRRVRLARSTSKFMMKQKITDIALESGYETNASFSKAFKKQFSMSPKAFSDKVKTTKGTTMLNPKYITLEPLDVLYVRNAS